MYKGSISIYDASTSWTYCKYRFCCRSNGNPGQANYVAAKAGVIGLTKTSAKELASRNITVNAIAPGFIATDMTDVLDENIKAEMLKLIPAAQFGEAQDIANAVTFCF